MPSPQFAHEMAADDAVIRRASHKGTWYDADYKKLARAIDTCLERANNKRTNASSSISGRSSEKTIEIPHGHTVHAVVSPHAGFTYSGPTQAHAFKHVQWERVRRVFILGPSHHEYMEGAHVSTCDWYETPRGLVPVDTEVITSLLSNKKYGNLFSTMSQGVDEQDHAIEMQLPYISEMMARHAPTYANGNDYGLARYTVVPILVGNLSQQQERDYGTVLEEYFGKEENLFVFSSDFCHWGKRFRYTSYDESAGEIYEWIARTDGEGMQAIETQSADTFRDYLHRTRNTICGRNPILILLNTLAVAKGKGKLHDNECAIEFTHYAQSSQCRSKSGSSVSYASAIVTAPLVK